ncbi:MAG TPA: hypothetical protein VIG24_00325 [Acidimicrobiia bacterium]
MTLDQPELVFDEHPGRHRQPDWGTSVRAGKAVAYRAGTQKAALLDAFRSAWPLGLTDEEAARRAGLSLSSEYSKRCGELRQDGYIAVEYVGSEPLTRPGSSGLDRVVSAALETPRPLPASDTLTARARNPREAVMLTERQADALIAGQPSLINVIAKRLDQPAGDPRSQAEDVVSAVADWLSSYRPEELADTYCTPLDVTAFILRKGQMQDR